MVIVKKAPDWSPGLSLFADKLQMPYNKNMQALSKRPVSYFKLDEDTLIDSSGYNRSISVSSRRDGLSVHSDTTRSLVLGSAASLAMGSPIFVSNLNTDFTLEANIVPIAQTQGITSQAYRENLILNPAASSNPDNSIQGIGNGVGNSAFLSDAQLPTGKFVRKTWTATPGSMGFGYMTNSVPVGNYTVSFWVRSNLTSFNFYCVEGTAVETNASFGVTLSPGVWTKVTGVIGVTSPGTLKIGGFISASVNGDYIDISSPLVEYGETLNTYFDGNFPGYKWSGTANASSSISDPDINAVNVVLNPSGNSLPSLQNQNGTISVSSEYAKFGTTSAKGVRGTGSGDNRVAIVADSYFTGKTNYASAWVYTLTARRVKLEIARRFGITGGENFIGQSSFQDIPANTWTKLTLPFDAGDYSTLRRIQVVGINFPEGEPMWVDGMLVSSVDTDYFDGSMPGNKWSGAADGSYSYKLVSNGLQSIVSNSNDGLTINGTVVSFSTIHGGVEAKCSYDIIQRRRLHVAGVHTKTKNMLYIDGQLAAEVDVPNTPISAPNVTLSSGQTNSAQAIEINSIGVYSRALVGQEIMDNAIASSYHNSNDNQSRYNAESVVIDNTVNSPYIDQTYTSEYPGFFDGVSEFDGSLYPSTVFNSTVEGTWTFSIPLSTPDLAPTVFSSYAQWEGKGFKVEASIENGVWFDVFSGADISQLKGITTAEKQITFRITFASGLNEAYLDLFRFVAFNRTSFTSGGFDYTLSNSVISFDPGSIFNQTEYRGARVFGGSLSFKRNSSVESPPAVKTVEVVVKKMGVDDPSLSASYTATGGYTNGEAVNTYIQGGYVIKHIVSNDGVDMSQNVTLSGNFEVISIKLYPEVLTQSQIKEVIANYTGTNKLKISDGNVIGVTESTNSTTLYAHDWAIVESSSL